MTEKPATRASQATHGPHTPPGSPGPHPAPADASQGRTALRDQIAEALYRHTMDAAAGGPARLLTRDETVLWENSLARADAVLHVIEHEILAAEVDATQRADELAARLEEAERQRDEALAAVQRVRRLQEMTIASSCRAGAIEQAEDTLRLLDQPKEEP